jgi:hypothetical protein
VGQALAITASGGNWGDAVPLLPLHSNAQSAGLWELVGRQSIQGERQEVSLSGIYLPEGWQPDLSSALFVKPLHAFSINRRNNVVVPRHSHLPSLQAKLDSDAIVDKAVQGIRDHSITKSARKLISL